MSLGEDNVTKRSRFTIRTSDRRVFRRCLRKWDYIASVRQNLTHKGTEQNINFWFGSAIHFALEDYHGVNHYGDPRKAFYAYYYAFPDDERPAGAEMHYELGMAMLSYYITWYDKHNNYTQFETIWFDENLNSVPKGTPGAVPAVEQRFFLPLDISVITDATTDRIYAQYVPNSENKVDAYPNHDGYLEARTMVDFNDNSKDIVEYYWMDTSGIAHPVNIVPMYYHGTMDRLVVDDQGRWWILDYKTAKSADTNKLDTDDQISAYIWAAEKWFKHPIYGFIYLQLTKDPVQEPRRLKNGELSTDKKQKTTYSLYKQELIKDYGSVNAAPNKHIQMLNELASKETPEGDRFIRWDFVKRNRAQIQATEQCIYGELQMMLNPFLYCYPNPTRDCIWDCPVRDICIAQDRGEEDVVKTMMLQWEERPRNEDGNMDPWRVNLMDTVDASIEELLDAAKCMTIEMDSLQEDTTGFQFLYEEDC